MSVKAVWLPYTAADPEFPANYRQFQYWPDQEIIYITDDYEPSAAEVVRVFYNRPQTLNGLDSASATTFMGEDDSLLLTGAAGFATTTRGIDLTEKITLDKITSQQVRAWGLGKLQEFRAALREIGRRAEGSTDSRVEMPSLDRWDVKGGWQ